MSKYSPRKERERCLRLYGRVIEQDQVAHPRLDGMTETVNRAFDVIDYMFKRKWLGELEYRAAVRLRTAEETLHGVVGNVMDFDRVRGRGLPGQRPPQPLCRAYGTVADFRATLDREQQELVKAVVFERVTLEQIAKDRNAGVYKRRIFDAVKKDLETALQALAAVWWPEGSGYRNGRILSFLMDDARPTIAMDGVIEIDARAYAAR